MRLRAMNTHQYLKSVEALREPKASRQIAVRWTGPLDSEDDIGRMNTRLAAAAPVRNYFHGAPFRRRSLRQNDVRQHGQPLFVGSFYPPSKHYQILETSGVPNGVCREISLRTDWGKQCRRGRSPKAVAAGCDMREGNSCLGCSVRCGARENVRAVSRASGGSCGYE